MTGKLRNIPRHRPNRHVAEQVVTGAVLSLLLAAGAVHAETSAAEAVTRLADRYYAFRLETTPELAYFAGIEVERHDGVSDNRPEALEQIRAVEDELWAGLARIDPAALRGTVAWTTYGFLRQALRSARDTRICRNEVWNVSQMGGWHLGIVQLAKLQPVDSAEQRQQALKRWRRYPDWVDQEIRNLHAGLAAGYSSPKAAVRRVIEQLDGLLAAPAGESPLASPVQRSEDGAFAAAFVENLEGSLLPAIARYRDFLRDTYLRSARRELAVTANPDGRACYEASLRAYTTLDRSAEQVYELGRRTVAANRAEVERLGEAAYGLDDLVAIISHIQQDSSDRFGNRQELLDFSRDAVARSRKAVPGWFGRVPQREAIVEPHPEYQEGTGVSARYESGTPTRPGVYRIPLYQPEEQSRGNAEATAFHEVWPGHHLQVSFAQEIEGLHPITRISWYSGMGEGWARYSEGLADEMGLYTTVTGPILRLAWPARGMVVDPGIHVMGWTREQARDFMRRAGRMTEEELDAMVDRIAVLPGQLTAYDSGGLEILALRKLAEERLGDAFDIRAFHDRVLENGTVPLTLLREHVEAWIRAGGDG
ncbi:MAG: DUF885 domain-containing protein [Xanthomonadales bacterium]|nr:DUF885 domain-containing protein [Xanthomonadales bacterium]